VDDKRQHGTRIEKPTSVTPLRNTLSDLGDTCLVKYVIIGDLQVVELKRILEGCKKTRAFD
jgi:hypothetical protein